MTTITIHGPGKQTLALLIRNALDAYSIANKAEPNLPPPASATLQRWLQQLHKLDEPIIIREED